MQHSPLKTSWPRPPCLVMPLRSATLHPQKHLYLRVAVQALINIHIGKGGNFFCIHASFKPPHMNTAALSPSHQSATAGKAEPVWFWKKAANGGKHLLHLFQSLAVKEPGRLDRERHSKTNRVLHISCTVRLRMIIFLSENQFHVMERFQRQTRRWRGGTSRTVTATNQAKITTWWLSSKFLHCSLTTLTSDYRRWWGLFTWGIFEYMWFPMWERPSQSCQWGQCGGGVCILGPIVESAFFFRFSSESAGISYTVVLYITNLNRSVLRRCHVIYSPLKLTKI